MKNLKDRIINVPEGFEIKVDKDLVSVKGNGKEISKRFDMGNAEVSVGDGKVKIGSRINTRRESKIIGTIWAHLKNMINGLQEDFVYKLEICNVHFPMNVKVEGDKVVIKSFLGETTQRIAQIMPNVKVEIKGNEITVSSHDVEAAGQTAANIEKATKLTGRDRRIFQDGIFIKEKNGRGM